MFRTDQLPAIHPPPSRVQDSRLVGTPQAVDGLESSMIAFVWGGKDAACLGHRTVTVFEFRQLGSEGLALMRRKRSNCQVISHRARFLAKLFVRFLGETLSDTVHRRLLGKESCVELTFHIFSTSHCTFRPAPDRCEGTSWTTCASKSGSRWKRRGSSTQRLVKTAWPCWSLVSDYDAVQKHAPLGRFAVLWLLAGEDVRH